MNNDLQKLEALLFVSGGSFSKKKLAGLLGCDGNHLDRLLNELQEVRKDSGVVLVDDGLHAVLATHPDLDDFMELTQKEEEESSLSKAAQETLSIIAYAGPIMKADLDFLRGVNTQYTLRRLAMRGLIRDSRERNTRTVSVTTDFLQYLGVRKAEDLPEYVDVRKSILTGLQSIKKRAEEREV